MVKCSSLNQIKWLLFSLLILSASVFIINIGNKRLVVDFFKKMSFHLAATLGSITAVGGIIGFIKAKSIPSLVAGLGIGGLFGASRYALFSYLLKLSHFSKYGFWLWTCNWSIFNTCNFNGSKRIKNRQSHALDLVSFGGFRNCLLWQKMVRANKWSLKWIGNGVNQKLTGN